MRNATVQPAPAGSDTAGSRREWLEHIAAHDAIADAIDAAQLPGWHRVPGVPDDVYREFGPRIDQLCAGIVDLLDDQVGGLKEPGTGDYLPPSGIVLAAVDHAINLALTDIAVRCHS
jgi:hypothetical protein